MGSRTEGIVEQKGAVKRKSEPLDPAVPGEDMVLREQGHLDFFSLTIITRNYVIQNAASCHYIQITIFSR